MRNDVLKYLIGFENRLMSKTSEFPKHVLEILFHFWNGQRFGHGLVGIIGKSCFWSGPKSFVIFQNNIGFPKYRLKV